MFLYGYFFVLSCYVSLRDLHPFPTRRSSDLSHGSHRRIPLQPAARRVGDAGVPAAWGVAAVDAPVEALLLGLDRKSTRLNSSHLVISYAVFCLKKKSS